MRIYHKTLGAHIHMRVFYKGLMGTLVCRDDEFADIKLAMPGFTFIEEVN